MAVIYANLVEAGRKTIEQVPARLREQVIEILKERGLIPDGENENSENQETESE